MFRGEAAVVCQNWLIGIVHDVPTPTWASLQKLGSSTKAASAAAEVAKLTW